MADARRVAGLLDIPFYVVDVKEHFRNTIVQFFIDEHERGRTPNPCIECNRQIRFSYLYERARTLNAHFLATGHYAQVVQQESGYELHQGKDAQKDQSYVLHMLSQEKLAHVLFPIGGYTKSEVRALAEKFKLPVANKSESQDLCFLGDGDYRRFLQEHSARVARPGPILDTAGNELGQHQGLAFYTIGQRKGLGISVGRQLFVLHKDAAENTLIVGDREQLGRDALVAHDVHWISGTPPRGPVPASIKIRYKAKAMPGEVEDVGNGQARVTFYEPVFGVTAGQGATFYSGVRCLGGGIIAGANAPQQAPSLQVTDIEVI